MFELSAIGTENSYPFVGGNGSKAPLPLRTLRAQNHLWNATTLLWAELVALLSVVSPGSEPQVQHSV